MLKRAGQSRSTILHPTLGTSRFATIDPRVQDMVAMELLELFPNLARVHLTVDYSLGSAFLKAEIRLVDDLGRIMLSRPLSLERDQVLIPLAMKPGTYRCELIKIGAALKSNLLVIQ